MKLTLGCWAVAFLIATNVVSATPSGHVSFGSSHVCTVGNGPGHPQCRRIDMIVGFPLSAGSTGCEQDGALLPAEGVGEVSCMMERTMIIVLERCSFCPLVVLTWVESR
jgi:hypothetical protein